jgi:hypothetical protein
VGESVLGPQGSAKLRPKVDVLGARVKEGLVHIGEQASELAPPARRERVRLQEVRDSSAWPVDRVERLTDDHLVALDQCHGMAGASERQRSGEAGHPGGENRDRRGRHARIVGCQCEGREASAEPAAAKVPLDGRRAGKDPPPPRHGDAATIGGGAK